MLAALCLLGALAGPIAAAHATTLAPSLSEAASPAGIQNGGTTSLQFFLSNPNDGPGNALSGIGFTETIPTGLLLVDNSGNPLSGDVFSSCSGNGTVTVDPTAKTITLQDVALSAGGACFFSVKVKATSPGSKTATTSTIDSIEGGSGAPASVTIDILGPPSLAVAFGAPSILVNATTTMTYTITNSNGVDQTGVAFSDTLPAGLTVATPNNLTGSCGGGATITAAAGSSSVSLSGGTVTASSTCTFSVDVKATSAGTKTNITGAVSSTNGGTGSAAPPATLLVVQQPTIATSFGAASIKVGGAPTTASFTITNPNAGTALTGVGFSDTLPAGLVVAMLPGVSGPCGSGGTISAVAGSSTISLSGSTLAAGASCTFTVNVAGTTPGAKTNTTGAVTSTESGPASTANASVNVFVPPTVAIAFGAPSMALGDASPLTFTITNPAGNGGSLGSVGVTGTLPAGLVVNTPNGLTGTCGGGTITAVAGSTSIVLSGATLTAGASCSYSVDVLANTTIGTKTVTTNAPNSTEGGSGTAASTSIDVAAAASLHLAFTPPSVAVGGTSTLTYTLANPTLNTVALDNVGFTDALPSGMTLTTPSGLSGSCGGGTITAPDGGNEVDLSGATLPVHGSCAFSVSVTASTLGTLTTTTSAITSSTGGNGAPASASLLVLQGPTLTTAFGAASIGAGHPVAASFTIHNPNPGTTLTGVALADTLPTGLVVAAPNGATGTCGGGTVTASPGGSAISLSGGSLAANASCTFSVNVTGTSPGLKTNTTGNVTSAQSGPTTNASASVTVYAPPTIASAFGAPAVAKGGSTTLAFTITNPVGNGADLTGVGFSDTLPAGLAIDSPNGVVSTCGTAVAVAGTPDITLSGATMPAGGTCSLTVNVVATGSGVLTNTTGPVTSTEAGSGATTTASLVVPSAPVLQIAFGAPSITLTELTTLTFTVSNPNPIQLTGVGFTDTFPSGLVLVTLKAIVGSCPSGTITATAGTSSVSLTGATLAANASCTFAVYVSGATLGAKDNSTGATTSIQSGSGGTASARLVIAPVVTPPPPSTTTTPTTPPPTTKTPKTPTKVVCVVPKLTGKTLTQAKKLLTKGHCKLGTIKRKKVKSTKGGRISAQGSKAGAKHRSGAHVTITLAK